MAGSVNHDDRPSGTGALCRDLELHVHLADCDLVCHRKRWRRRRARGRRLLDHSVVCDFGHPADEEAALILNHQWTAEELLVTRLPRKAGCHRHNQDRERKRADPKPRTFASHRGLPTKCFMRQVVSDPAGIRSADYSDVGASR
jgi:hypothetical protein